MRRPLRPTGIALVFLAAMGILQLAGPARAQMIDQTQAPNTAHDGISKSLTDEIGPGRGDWNTPGSASFLINRDPFRAIRRGREIFQRKFTRLQNQGPAVQDGVGDIDTVIGIGAGLSDSCAGCHGRPRGGAGNGGDVVTRPDSRDAPHLYGLGLKEMLADEITTGLRAIQAQAVAQAQAQGRIATYRLLAKGIDYGTITASPSGAIDTSGVQGVDPDLRVRPFFAHGGTISIREFVVGALHAEMGLDSADPDLSVASAHGHVVTPSGMILDGRIDKVEAPPIPNPAADPNGDVSGNEVPTALVDYLEFYLLNYFKPATYLQTRDTLKGLKVFHDVGCDSCHVANLTIDHDRRVADVETIYDPAHGIMNSLFATAAPLVTTLADGSGFPALKKPMRQPFLVKNIFTDFKRHDLGPNFYERNWDGTLQKEFMTRPLWGIGTKGSFGHDGRSVNLMEVILRHGGEAQASRDEFALLNGEKQNQILAYLQSLVLFPPDDTASNLDPGDRSVPNFPQFGHGSIKLTALFNDPTDKE
ncbi:MAG TPA: di-heme oxidoredictase family protein [Thermoanaerobaculia bacterium]|nr:di-heme oxidoredictase family protein [Thermoanaerobaculia bacterium]